MTRSSTTTRSLTYLIALGDVARRQALHDSCVVVGLLEAMSMVLTGYSTTAPARMRSGGPEQTKGT